MNIKYGALIFLVGLACLYVFKKESFCCTNPQQDVHQLKINSFSYNYSCTAREYGSDNESTQQRFYIDSDKTCIIDSKDNKSILAIAGDTWWSEPESHDKCVVYNYPERWGKIYVPDTQEFIDIKNLCACAWNNAGTSLLICQNDGTIYTLDVDSRIKKPLPSLSDSMNGGIHFLWSADDSKIVYVAEGVSNYGKSTIYEIRCVDAQTGKTLARVQRSNAVVQDSQLSPDGRVCAVMESSGENRQEKLVVWKMDTCSISLMMEHPMVRDDLSVAQAASFRSSRFLYWSSDSTFLLAYALGRKYAWILDISSLKIVKEFGIADIEKALAASKIEEETEFSSHWSKKDNLVLTVEGCTSLSDDKITAPLIGVKFGMDA